MPPDTTPNDMDIMLVRIFLAGQFILNLSRMYHQFGPNRGLNSTKTQIMLEHNNIINPRLSPNPWATRKGEIRLIRFPNLLDPSLTHLYLTSPASTLELNWVSTLKTMVVKKPKIVIIGAGMAGLTAAHRLRTTAGSFFDLSIIEAGNRIGGRILTSQFAGDRVEMGATWIHGIDGSPIHALADKLQLLTDPHRPWERMDGFPENPVTVAEGGTVIDDATIVAPITDLYRRLMDAARSGDAPVAKESPGVGPYLRRGLLQCRAVAASGGVSAALEDAVFAVHENNERTCTSADDLADLDLAAESEYRDFPGEQITIGCGFSRIIEHLAAALPAGAISFGRQVRRIEWRPDGGGADPAAITIHFDDGTAAAADHVIITVSLGVLKAGMEKGAAGVEFSPALPAFKREAIGRLGFGVVNKLFMELEGDLSPLPFLQLAFQPAAPSKIPWWMRKTGFIAPIYGGSPVALAWLAGEEAAAIEGIGDDEIVGGIEATLDGFGYGGIRCVAVKRSGWGGDPLFLGSYSYVAVGASGDDLDLMAEPLPRGGGGHEAAALQLLFAGEATHRTHYSTTHGAYFSGIREADRLLQHYHRISS